MTTKVRGSLSGIASLSISKIASELRKIAFLTKGDFAPWEEWEPQYGGTGTLTYTSVVTRKARYFILGQLGWFTIEAIGTTGGAGNAITFTLPFTPISLGDVTFSTYIEDGGGIAGYSRLLSGNTVRVFRYDSVNWGAAAGRLILVNGFCELN